MADRDATDAVRIRRARDLIAARGWTRGEYEGGGGCLCLVAALGVACGGEACMVPHCRGWSEYARVVRLVRADPDVAPTDRGRVSAMPEEEDLEDWNDAAGRELAEVLELLDRAAARAGELGCS